MATSTLPQRIDELYTLNRACNRLRVHRQRVLEEIALGRLKAIVAGERLLISATALQEYEAAHRAGE